MRKRQVIAIVAVFLLIGLSTWLVLSYFAVVAPEVELRVHTTESIGTVHQLVGVNDYGPDVTELYEDQIAYDLFQSVGLQRFRVWCQFGKQLAEGLGWDWHHTILMVQR
ncbi:MAG: hypothetical protein ACFFDJ_09530 [Candidatus Odinarchaeota archaeon]